MESFGEWPTITCATNAKAARGKLRRWSQGRNYQKRSGDAERVSLDEAATMAEESATELIALDEALQELAKFDPRKSRIVEIMKSLGGVFPCRVPTPCSQPKEAARLQL